MWCGAECAVKKCAAGAECAGAGAKVRRCRPAGAEDGFLRLSGAHTGLPLPTLGCPYPMESEPGLGAEPEPEVGAEGMLASAAEFAGAYPISLACALLFAAWQLAQLLQHSRSGSTLGGAAAKEDALLRYWHPRYVGTTPDWHHAVAGHLAPRSANEVVLHPPEEELRLSPEE